MSESIFRGNCQQAKLLNAIGEGIESLCETEIGGEGENTKKTFPVRSQLTWFRLIHKYGSIRTNKIFADDEQAEFEAVVYDEQERFLQSAHGTATYADDGVRGFKLIETAESRSIARALSGAGFGCQLNLGYFEEGEPGGPDGSKRIKREDPLLDSGEHNNSDIDQGDKNVASPGTVNGNKIVSRIDSVAREETEPDASMESPTDEKHAPQLTVVSTGAASKASTSTKPERAKKGVAKVVSETPPALDKETVQEAEKPIAQPESVTKDIPEHAIPKEAEKADNTVDSEKVIAVSAGTNENVQIADQAPVTPLTPAEKLAANTVYQQVKKQFDEIKANPTEIKNAYFTAEDVSGNGKYINRQKTPTHMDAMELQNAITVLEANKDSYMDIPAPLHENSERFGMTFGELMQDATGTGKNLIAALSEMYRKDNALAFAAALICTKTYGIKLVENPAA